MKRMRSASRRVGPLGALSALVLSGCLSTFGGGMSDELREKGVSAPADVLEIWDTGWTINDNPVIGMKVRVRPADRPAFEATIEKTTVSRIAVPQFQPGARLWVRFDPDDPRLVAVDPEGPSRPAASSGNPYRDGFVGSTNVGASFLPPPAAPAVYLGTADSAADVQALYENDYALLGASSASGAPDVGPALEHGREVGAALVVVYGRFLPPGGRALDVLPYRPRPAGAGGEQGSGAVRGAALFSNLGPDDQVASYWGKTRPAILGIVSRPLDGEEQARLGRRDGIVVEGVSSGSPAEAAGIQAGDVVVAVDGRPLPDAREVPALITSLAGRKVRFDLLRGGRPLSVDVSLHPASP